MIHAALDSSIKCTLTIADDDKILFTDMLESASRDNDRKLPPWILQAAKSCNVTLKDIRQWTVGTGPGSFAGLRSGIAHIMGICTATGAQLRGVPSAIATAAKAKPASGQTVGAIMDGRCGEIILIMVKDNVIQDTPCALLPEDLLQAQYRCDLWITPQPQLVPPLPEEIQDKLLTAEAVDPAVLLFNDTIPWPQAIGETVASCEPIYVRPPVFVQPKPIHVIA